MDNSNSAILALILLIIVVIIVVVALAYNPAPATVEINNQTAKDLLKTKTNCRGLKSQSSMSPPTRVQLSPESVQSMSNEPWRLLDEMRERKARENK